MNFNYVSCEWDVSQVEPSEYVTDVTIGHCYCQYFTQVVEKVASMLFVMCALQASRAEELQRVQSPQRVLLCRTRGEIPNNFLGSSESESVR